MGRMIIGVRRRDISADARWCCHFKDLLALLLSVGLVTKFTKDFRHLFLLFGKFAKKEGVAMLLLATSSSATTYLLPICAILVLDSAGNWDVSGATEFVKKTASILRV